MIYHSIADIFEMIEKAHARFATSVAGLTEMQENFRPAPDRWTIAENAEHVSIVNNGFLRLTHKLLKQAEAEPKAAKNDLQLPPLTMTVEGELMPGKWSAPEIVHPQGGVPVADAVAKNQQSINDLFKLRSRLESVDLSEQTWPHPALGRLSLYQWLLLLGEHEERHRLQIEEVKSSAGFPA
ncbi:MAG: DinB family protein [Acidobacteria bacterium]|nr:DinB family protein [Acidobacteriota bacterium]